MEIYKHMSETLGTAYKDEWACSTDKKKLLDLLILEREKNQRTTKISYQKAKYDKSILGLYKAYLIY